MLEKCLQEEKKNNKRRQTTTSDSEMPGKKMGEKTRRRVRGKRIEGIGRELSQIENMCLGWY